MSPTRTIPTYVLTYLMGISAMPLATGCAQSREPSVKMLIDGQDVALNAETRRQVVANVERIIESANFSSLHHPQYFKEATPADEVLKDAYLRIDYPRARTFETVGGRLTAQAIDVALAARQIPGPFLLRNGDTIIRISKENGAECVRLARLPGFNEHLPAEMRDQWRDYDVVIE